MQRFRTIEVRPVIELAQVMKAFGSFVAVHETDLRVGEGEFFSLLGPSGCGKTTTLRMIAGFERPTRGRILLDGADVSKVAPYRRDVNTVFQQYALFPHLDVFENVAFGLRSARTPAAEIRRRVHEMLDVVRLPDLAHRRPHQLSGGQQQRVALARALVNRPRALLLDEPLGALDLKLRETMQLELKRIQRELGSTFVYVTHDQFEALTMSDRIAVMHRGRTEQVGTPREVYRHPTSAFVASFIGTTNLLAARVSARAGDTVEVVVAGLGTFRLPAPSPEATAGEVRFMLRPEVVSISATPPDDGRPSVVATVVETLFTGAVLRCRARTDGGATLVADLGPAAAADAVAGATRYVSWSSHDAGLVPAHDEPAHDEPAHDEPAHERSRTERR